MKILVVTPYFYPQIGGLESYVYFVSKALIEAGENEVVIVSSHPKGSGDIVESIDGLKVYRLETMFTLSNTPVNPLWLFKISKIIETEKPDIISAHSPVPFMADLASFVAKLMRVPFVLTYHAGSFKKNLLFADIVTSVYSHTVEKYMFSNSKRIIALNEFVRDTTLRNSKGKVALILPGITLRTKKADLKTRRNSMQKILFLAKLDKTHAWKGLSYLLQAMKIVLNKYPHVNLEVVGGGDYLHFYKKMSKTLNIDKNVRFIGTVRNIEVEKFYAQSDLFVLPSYSNAESLGLVLLEAMTFGLPIVATRVGGIPYTIKNRVNGILVQPESPASIANAILELMNDKLLFEKMRKNNFEKAKEYDWKKHISALETLFKTVIKNEKR